MYKRLFTVLLVFLSVVGFADDTTRKANENKIEVMVADFQVTDLSPSVIKKLATALNGQKGILAAKPDMGKKTFSVTFEKGITSTDEIKTLVAKAHKGSKFVKVGIAPKGSIPASKCGGCPSASSCSESKKK